MNIFRTYCVYLFFFVSSTYGCASSPPLPEPGSMANGEWMSDGVKNPRQIAVMMEKHARLHQISWRKSDRDADIIHGLMLSLSWEQAAEIYKTSELMKYHLFPYVFHRDFDGMTKSELINTLGKPDAIWDDDYLYGDDSDSGSAFIFMFNEKDIIVGVGAAN